jgi:hypothetical protein
MAAAANRGPVPDLYQVLGVSRGASGGEITRSLAALAVRHLAAGRGWRW